MVLAEEGRSVNCIMIRRRGKKTIRKIITIATIMTKIMIKRIIKRGCFICLNLIQGEKKGLSSRNF